MNRASLIVIMLLFLIGTNVQAEPQPNRFQKTVAKTMSKLITVTTTDIAKLCIKYIANQMITHRTYFHFSSFSIRSDHVIDYGCEAAWAGVADDVDAIPYQLMRYACVDTCYHHLEKAAAYYALEYPVAIKNNGYMSMLAHIIVPLICKRGLMYCTDCITDSIMGNECETDLEQL